MDTARLAKLLNSPDVMSGTDWDTLVGARKELPLTDPRQAQLAPYEHRAWAREQVADNPFLAPAYAAMIPGYQLAKAVMSFAPGQTGPSMDQFTNGMKGVGEGLQQWWNR
jgi:hypothetical protein